MTWWVGATVGVWFLSAWCAIRAARVRGILRKLRALLAAALTAALGLLLGALLIVLHLFYAFTGEALVARIRTQPTGPDTFELLYQPTEARTLPVRATLRGDQWSVSGGIVKWHPWLTALGLASYHRPTRLSGQFSSLRRQQAEPQAVQALGPADRVWEALYRAAPYLPIIDAAYGSAAWAYVEPDVWYDVYISPTGYLIRRRPFAAAPILRLAPRPLAAGSLRIPPHGRTQR